MKAKAQRKIAQTWKVYHFEKSEIHTVGLVLPIDDLRRFDPFLALVDDQFQSKAFDHHPHRGMETVTYVLDGELHHVDNKGGRGVLRPGDAQWMTAGSGLIHLEAPLEGTTVHILQLWVNLPKVSKMVPPRYQDILGNGVPRRIEDGVIYRVYSGNSKDVISTTKNYAPITIVEILVEPGHTANQDLPSDYRGFMYILEGSGVFGENKVKAGTGEVVLLQDLREKFVGSEITFSASNKLRVIFYAGRPLNEPVAARGPFVMNTEEELMQAYADYGAGKF